MTKVCNECKAEKPAEDFYLVALKKGGPKVHLAPVCKPCGVVRLRRYRERRKEQFGSHGHHLVKTYGITVEQYQEMHERQGGLCAICGQANVRGLSLAVDHCHETGEIRGLLCNPCNSGVGLLGDDPARLQAAIDYLSGGRRA